MIPEMNGFGGHSYKIEIYCEEVTGLEELRFIDEWKARHLLSRLLVGKASVTSKRPACRFKRNVRFG